MTRLTTIGLLLLSTGWLVGCPPSAQKLTPADLAIRRPNADVLVVVYSRTGNTARKRQGGRTLEALTRDLVAARRSGWLPAAPPRPPRPVPPRKVAGQP